MNNKFKELDKALKRTRKDKTIPIGVSMVVINFFYRYNILSLEELYLRLAALNRRSNRFTSIQSQIYIGLILSAYNLLLLSVWNDFSSYMIPFLSLVKKYCITAFTHPEILSLLLDTSFICKMLLLLVCVFTLLILLFPVIILLIQNFLNGMHELHDPSSAICIYEIKTITDLTAQNKYKY